MVAIRARYVNGNLVPLTPIQTLQEGDEVEIYLDQPNDEVSPEAVKASLDKSRGIWADADDIETAIQQARERWDAEWRTRQTTL